MNAVTLSRDPAERFAAALDWINRVNGNMDEIIARAAYQFNVDRESLKAAYDQSFRNWAADRGYDL